MAASLKRGNDCLTLSLSGMPSAEFQDAKAKIKSITGRRWNPTDKVWEFPDELDTAIKIVQMVQPDVSAELQADIKDSSARIAGELTTEIGEDAELAIPWGDTLYAYQRAGVRWLADHPHSILADDMGLGKTLQSISAVYERAAQTGSQAWLPGRVLICAPNAMKRTWSNEIQKWAGVHESDIAILDGSKPQREKILARKTPWLIVNYEKLRIVPELANENWYAIIADEAHRIKNRKAQQTQAMFKLTAEIQLALTGTPIMNSPDEIWSILRWLYGKDEYGSYWRFHNQYVDDYEVNYGGRKARVIIGVKNADDLRFALANKLIRRTKDKVLDLPEKTHQTIPLELKPLQRKLYTEIENQMLVEIKQAFRKAEENDDPSVRKHLEAFAETGDVGLLHLIIPNGAAKTTRQRQITSSPALLGEADESVKYDAVDEIIGDNKGKPFVVFCWFKPATEIIADRLRRKHKLRAQAMNGDTSSADRDSLIERFQAGELDVLVCTISTGGVGLTLTAADTAIFVERDWTPAINQQAEDRLHRIGQTNHVTIITLEASDTVDTGKVGPKNRLKESIVTQILGS